VSLSPWFPLFLLSHVHPGYSLPLLLCRLLCCSPFYSFAFFFLGLCSCQVALKLFAFCPVQLSFSYAFGFGQREQERYLPHSTAQYSTSHIARNTQRRQRSKSAALGTAPYSILHPTPNSMLHTPYRPTTYHPIQSSPLTEEPQPMQQIARARLGPKLRSCKVRGAQRGASGF